MALPATPAVAVDAIVEGEEGIVLVKRGGEPFSGMWALPGGFVRVGESVEEAVEREGYEETGLKFRLKRLHGIYSQPGRDPRGHVISLCFVGEGAGRPRGGDDARAARFFPVHELMGLDLAFDHKRILRDYLEAGDVL
ncbi:MAG: NUDIX hydrolase [Methanobacteriota archaeon]|nr:MAG: NUDIX hydrolase [Euryarchaeota archaeon]